VRVVRGFVIATGRVFLVPSRRFGSVLIVGNRRIRRAFLMEEFPRLITKGHHLIGRKVYDQVSCCEGRIVSLYRFADGSVLVNINLDNGLEDVAVPFDGFVVLDE
jgi:hypothetical protein